MSEKKIPRMLTHGLLAGSALLAGVGMGVVAGLPLKRHPTVPYRMGSAVPMNLQWQGNVDQQDFSEPSGLCYHAERDSLFVVGDEGDIGEFRRDGTALRQQRLRKADLEGITVVPSSGFLYVAVEGKEQIWEVDPRDFKITREFQIERTLQGETMMASGGDGFEGITFVPDEKHPHGGTFFMAHQNFKIDEPHEVSGLVEVELPLKSGAATEPIGRILRVLPLGVPDLSAVCFEAATSTLWVVSDTHDLLLDVSLNGEIRQSFLLPGCEQEGIALDNQGMVFVAQDSGGIIAFRWLR